MGAPFTESSHTKQEIKTIVSKSLQSVDTGVLQSQVPSFSMKPANVVPPPVQTGIPLSMRGTPTQGLGVAAPPPSNLMAGQIPPKPLSAAPAPVQGKPGASMSTGKPGGQGSLVLRKEGLSIPIPKNSTVAGTLRIQIPYQNNKPLFEKIKDIIFVPRSLVAPKPGAAPMAPKPPPPVAPPRVFVGRKRVRKYKDGRVVDISRGKAVTTYPDGRRVIMKRNKLGRMVTTTIKPNGVRIVNQGRRTILIQPNGQRVITKRGPFGRVTVVTLKTDGTRIVQKGGKTVVLKRRR